MGIKAEIKQIITWYNMAEVTPSDMDSESCQILLRDNTDGFSIVSVVYASGVDEDTGLYDIIDSKDRLITLTESEKYYWTDMPYFKV